MANEEKGLDYYLEHPEEADPNDHALMSKLLAQAGESDKVAATATTDKVTEGDEGKDGKAATDEAAAKAAADEKAKQDAEAQAKADADKATADAKAKADAEEAAAGVATKDGKGIIPFEVLQDSRARTKAEADARALAEADATAARKEAADVRAQLEQALKDKGVAIKTTTTVDGQSTLAEMDAAIEGMKEEAPWMVPALTAMRNAVATSEARAKKAEEDVAALHQERAAEANAAVGEAVNNNAALILWHAKNPAAWGEAIKRDAELRVHPLWKEKPIADRLNKVVELVASVHGDAVLPPGYSPSGSKKDPPAADPAKGIDPAKAKALAAEKLKNADTAATTLSDIPGGDATEADPLDNVEKQSVAQLGAMFMNMNPQQQEAYLRKFS